MRKLNYRGRLTALTTKGITLRLAGGPPFYVYYETLENKMTCGGGYSFAEACQDFVKTARKTIARSKGSIEYFADMAEEDRLDGNYYGMRSMMAIVGNIEDEAYDLEILIKLLETRYKGELL